MKLCCPITQQTYNKTIHLSISHISKVGNCVEIDSFKNNMGYSINHKDTPCIERVFSTAKLKLLKLLVPTLLKSWWNISKECEGIPFSPLFFKSFFFSIIFCTMFILQEALWTTVEVFAIKKFHQNFRYLPCLNCW